MCASTVLHTYVSACKCHKREHTTHVRVCHMHTHAIRVPHQYKQTWALISHDETLRIQYYHNLRSGVLLSQITMVAHT